MYVASMVETAFTDAFNFYSSVVPLVSTSHPAQGMSLEFRPSAQRNRAVLSALHHLRPSQPLSVDILAMRSTSQSQQTVDGHLSPVSERSICPKASWQPRTSGEVWASASRPVREIFLSAMRLSVNGTLLMPRTSSLCCRMGALRHPCAGIRASIGQPHHQLTLAFA